MIYNLEKNDLWQSRRKTIDIIINSKYNTPSDTALEFGIDENNEQYITEKHLQSFSMGRLTREMAKNENLKKNPFIKILLKIKRMLGIKFY